MHNSKNFRIFACALVNMSRSEVKYQLVNMLKVQNSFWSYAPSDWQNIPDDMLIEKTLIYLDLPQIDQLIAAYGKNRVKNVFRERLIPQEDYLYTLNRFLAWYYFDVKQPDRYLRQQATRQLNKLTA